VIPVGSEASVNVLLTPFCTPDMAISVIGSPDKPLDPEVPVVPDVPLEPDVPVVPLVPVVPDVPEVPLVPDVVANVLAMYSSIFSKAT
jgi:hypothetical protein